MFVDLIVRLQCERKTFTRCSIYSCNASHLSTLLEYSNIRIWSLQNLQRHKKNDTFLLWIGFCLHLITGIRSHNWAEHLSLSYNRLPPTTLHACITIFYYYCVCVCHNSTLLFIQKLLLLPLHRSRSWMENRKFRCHLFWSIFYVRLSFALVDVRRRQFSYRMW